MLQGSVTVGIPNAHSVGMVRPGPELTTLPALAKRPADL